MNFQRYGKDNEKSLVHLIVFQSISREKLFLEAKWDCSDLAHYIDHERFVKIRKSLSVELYQKTEEYISRDFKHQMEKCLNSEEKRKQREEIVIK